MTIQIIVVFFSFQSSSGTWGTEKKTYIDIDTAHNVRKCDHQS